MVGSVVLGDGRGFLCPTAYQAYSTSSTNCTADWGTYWGAYTADPSLVTVSNGTEYRWVVETNADTTADLSATLIVNAGEYRVYPAAPGGGVGVWVPWRGAGWSAPPPDPQVLAQQARAAKRAERLLREQLCGRELQSLRRFGFFDVRSRQNPDVAYRIPESGMLVCFERGAPVKRLCIHPGEALPRGDRLLALKLLAEAEPEELHRIANVHPLDATRCLQAPRVERVPLLC